VATGAELDEHEDKGFPEPTGPLNKSVPMKAIKLANAKVVSCSKTTFLFVSAEKRSGWLP